MRIVKPNVHLIASPRIHWDALKAALIEQTGKETDWYQRAYDHSSNNAEILVEFGGRECYRSWEPGLNANVTKVREDSRDYLGNILSSGHGSVLEHANFSFVFSNVSRIFTHEFVRHRAGVAVSQESMRFVRLTDLPVWFPEWALEDTELMHRLEEYIEEGEKLQLWMADHFGLDKSSTPFHEKKAKTSFMRRFAIGGHATHMLATINVRALRHIVYMRTALGAEEEIRIVCDLLATLSLAAVPNLMQDYHRSENAEWIPDFLKV
jgi:thymidylate synthase (FAD)